MLRVFIRAMHNRVGAERRLARDRRSATSLVLVPLVLVVILALALYPQFALKRSEPAAKASVAAARVDRRRRASPSTTQARATP